jgi:hypothetical protein
MKILEGDAQPGFDMPGDSSTDPWVVVARKNGKEILRKAFYAKSMPDAINRGITSIARSMSGTSNALFVSYVKQLRSEQRSRKLLISAYLAG